MEIITFHAFVQAARGSINLTEVKFRISRARLFSKRPYFRALLFCSTLYRLKRPGDQSEIHRSYRLTGTTILRRNNHKLSLYNVRSSRCDHRKRVVFISWVVFQQLGVVHEISHFNVCIYLLINSALPNLDQSIASSSYQSGSSFCTLEFVVKGLSSVF